MPGTRNGGSVGLCGTAFASSIIQWQVADRSLLDTGDVPITLEREKREEASKVAYWAWLRNSHPLELHKEFRGIEINQNLSKSSKKFSERLQKTFNPLAGSLLAVWGCLGTDRPWMTCIERDRTQELPQPGTRPPYRLRVKRSAWHSNVFVRWR